LAYLRFRKGVEFDFLWAYDEVAVVTKGSLTVRFGDERVTAHVRSRSACLLAPLASSTSVRTLRRSAGTFPPTVGRVASAGERRPAEEEIRAVSLDEAWP
jgi:hypothetical protein